MRRRRALLYDAREIFFFYLRAKGFPARRIIATRHNAINIECVRLTYRIIRDSREICRLISRERYTRAYFFLSFFVLFRPVYRPTDLAVL